MFLQLKNITKTYPGVVALDDVSLEITEGEVHALVGENGAGKSTLIKTCTGAITPDKGTIIIKGQEFSGLTPKTSEQMGVGVIYQEFNLVDELSVGRAWPRCFRVQRIDHFAQRVGDAHSFAVDALRRKYGGESIHRASSLPPHHNPG